MSPAWALIPASWSFCLHLCMCVKGCLLVPYLYIWGLSCCLSVSGLPLGVILQLFTSDFCDGTVCNFEIAVHTRHRLKWSAGKWIPHAFKNRILATKKTLVVVCSCIASTQSKSDALWRGQEDSVRTTPSPCLTVSPQGRKWLTRKLCRSS